MLIYEFIERTGYFPTSAEEWLKICDEYTNTEAHKNDFCAKWVESHKRKVKNQQDITKECFAHTIIGGNGNFYERGLLFMYYIIHELKIKRNIRTRIIESWSSYIEYVVKQAFGEFMNIPTGYSSIEAAENAQEQLRDYADKYRKFLKNCYVS